MPVKFNNSLKAERLRELLSYDKESGLLTWRVSQGSRGVGVVAGNALASGAVQIQIDGDVYVAHRLAWLFVYGVFPPAEIDHRDLNPGNNRWTNLRPASRSQNSCNRRRNASNTSGYKGVYWHQEMRRWCARIKLRGKVVWREYFDDPAMAHRAYVEKLQEIHGEFARAA